MNITLPSLMIEALEQSILFFPLALSIYLSYIILKTTDMTTEGSFVLGAGAFARLVTSGVSSHLSILFSILLGGLAGIGVSLIQYKDRINSLIAGIIGLFILYSLNFQAMGRPNIGLHNFSLYSKTWIFCIILAITVIFMSLLASRFGLLLRAFGSNATLLKSLGKNIELFRIFGLGLSNAIAALCGVMTASINGYADLNMGLGMTLTGIGTVVIGRQLLYRLFPVIQFNAFYELIACFIGVYLYFLAINVFLSLGVDPIYLKLVLGVFLIAILGGRK